MSPETLGATAGKPGLFCNSLIFMPLAFRQSAKAALATGEAFLKITATDCD